MRLRPRARRAVPIRRGHRCRTCQAPIVASGDRHHLLGAKPPRWASAIQVWPYPIPARAPIPALVPTVVLEPMMGQRRGPPRPALAAVVGGRRSLRPHRDAGRGGARSSTSGLIAAVPQPTSTMSHPGKNQPRNRSPTTGSGRSICHCRRVVAATKLDNLIRLLPREAKSCLLTPSVPAMRRSSPGLLSLTTAARPNQNQRQARATLIAWMAGAKMATVSVTSAYSSSRFGRRAATRKRRRSLGLPRPLRLGLSGHRPTEQQRNANLRGRPHHP